jgi:hypothetical protein
MNTSDLIATKIYDPSLFSYLYKRQKKNHVNFNVDCIMMNYYPLI